MDVLWALVFLTMMLKIGKDRQKRDKRRKRKNQGQTASDIVRAQENNQYDAWIVLTHDACSNALRTTQLDFKKHIIGLNIEFITKTQILKTHFQKTQQIDQFNITKVR